MPRYGAWPCRFNSWTVNNIDSVQPDSNVDMLVRRAGGETHPTATGVLRKSNMCGFTTRDIHEVLTNASPTNAAKGLVVTTASLQFRQKGTDAGTAAHPVVQSTKGFVYVTDFGATHDAAEGADINFRFQALQNGANAPFSLVNNQTLTGTPVVTAQYKLGPCSLEGTAIRIQGWRLTTGFNYVAKGDSGNVSPDEGTIDEEQFSLTIDTDDITLSTWFGDGQAISTGTTVYLRKVGVADNVAEHISVSISAGTYTTPSMPVSGTGDATGRIECSLEARPTISLNQTIPASAVVS